VHGDGKRWPDVRANKTEKDTEPPRDYKETLLREEMDGASRERALHGDDGGKMGLKTGTLLVR